MHKEPTFDEWLVVALSHPKIQKSLEEGRTVTTIKPDSDVLGATTGQAELLMQKIPSWNPAMTDTFFMRTNPVAMKLTALRYHLRRYRKIQENRRTEISSNELLLTSMKKGLKFCEMEMLHEVEALFFQYKSTLDMLVKVLCVVTGKPATTFPTYGKYGSKLLPTLRKLKDDRNLNLTNGRIDWLIEVIEKAKSPWLDSVINIRDTFSHYRTDTDFGFTWDVAGEAIVLPTYQTQNGVQQFDLVMEELINYLIRYCADFIAISISCAMPLEQGIQRMSQNEKEYMSALWNRDLSRAEWWPARNVIIHYTEQDIENARQRGKTAHH